MTALRIHSTSGGLLSRVAHVWSQVSAWPWPADANDGVVPRGVGAGAGAHRPRGLAVLGQLGRPSSLVELDVAI